MSSAEPPRIETPRLLLRGWGPGDVGPFFRISSEPEVARFILAPADLEAARVYVRRMIADWADEARFGVWAVELRGEGLIGAVGLRRVRADLPFAPAVEILWRIARNRWGMGYAAEAARAALRHGFGPGGLGEIVAFTVPANAPSWRLMERLGMARDAGGDFAHPALPPGHPLGAHVLYRLARDDWAG